MISIVTWLWKSDNPHPKKQMYFGADHVNRLASMLKRNIDPGFDYELVCVTDMADGIDESVRVFPLWPDYREMGGCYRRLKMFSNSYVNDFRPYILSMDLDTVIVGNVTNILRTVVNKDFQAWGDTHPRTHYNGSLWSLRMGSNPQVWDEFIRNPRDIPTITRHKGFVGTDQAVFSHVFGESKAKWGKRDGVYSFNIHHVKSKHPELYGDERIVFFHGKADPSQTFLYNDYPWIQQHWR